MVCGLEKSIRVPREVIVEDDARPRDDRRRLSSRKSNAGGNQASGQQPKRFAPTGKLDRICALRVRQAASSRAGTTSELKESAGRVTDNCRGPTSKLIARGSDISFCTTITTLPSGL